VARVWEKYLMISAQAGMTALTRAPIGVIRAVLETWRMYRAIVEELAAVARAEGVRLDDGAVGLDLGTDTRHASRAGLHDSDVWRRRAWGRSTA
jgi:ketopantoate reductase